jgi:cysteine desulfurase
MPADSNLYFDYQASTPLDPRVAELVASISVASFANAHAEDHATGWAAREIIETARQQVSESIGALPEEIIFTSGATEADNLGVLGAALGAPAGRRRVLVSAFEHKAVLESAAAAMAYGYVLEIIPVTPDGLVDVTWLEKAAGPDVAVISVMAVNNEIGTVQPITDVARIGAAVGAFVHTDATQAPAAFGLDVFRWGVDAASFSSHKVYGPKGVGALYLSSVAPWRPRPLMFGGGQEQGLRPGTLPTALCAGFGYAMTLLNDAERLEIAAKRDRFYEELRGAVHSVTPTCIDTPRHPGCLHVRFPGADGKDLITRLQPQLSASTGSACASGLITASHVLQAIGLSDQEAGEGVRFSIGRFTTPDDIKRAVRLIKVALAATQESDRFA